MNKNNEIKLKVRVDSDGVLAVKNEAKKLADKANSLLKLIEPFGKIEILNIVDILPAIQKILDSKLNNSTGVTYRAVALLIGLEAEYLKLTKDCEDLLNSFLYVRYARL